MKEDQLRQILQFFFFVTLSEERSKLLAREAWHQCLKKKEKNPKLNPEHIMLLALEKSWETISHEARTGVADFSADSGLLLPLSVKLEPWKEFQKTASSDELFITVVTQILKVSEKTVTEVLGISSGTIRYRLSRTIRRVGIAVGHIHEGRM